MKRSASLFSIALFAIILLAPAGAGAMSLSVGGSLWYVTWEPAWAGTSEVIGTEIVNFELSPSYMYGPFASLRFYDSFVFSVVCMNGSFTAESSMSGGTWERKIKRRDVDSTLLYRVNGYFSVFLGIKLQEYSYEETHVVAMNPMSASEDFQGYGPGVGAGITLPVFESLFLSWNASFIYMKNEDTRHSTFTGTSHFSTEVIGYGGNSTLTASWVFPAVNITISAGYRYQLIRFRQDSVNADFFNYDGKIDRFHGFSFSAMYTMDFT